MSSACALHSVASLLGSRREVWKSPADGVRGTLHDLRVGRARILVGRESFLSPEIRDFRQYGSPGATMYGKSASFRVHCAKGFSSNKVPSSSNNSPKKPGSSNPQQKGSKSDDKNVPLSSSPEVSNRKSVNLQSAIKEVITKVFTAEELSDNEDTKIAPETEEPQTLANPETAETPKTDSETAETTVPDPLVLLAETERQARLLAEKEAREKELLAALQEKEDNLRRLEEEKLDLMMNNLRIEQEYKKSKVFFNPNVVKAGEEVEIFFHKSNSVLKDEPSASIMGAFNEWLWGNFRADLVPTRFSTEWWSCKITIPKEAFILDFVFSGSSNKFENNNQKDFHAPVVGGMTEEEFALMYAKIKKEEDERKAAEAEKRERLAEEERKKAQIRAEEEADRAQAASNFASLLSSAEAEYKNSSRSQFGVWYTKPEKIEPGATIELFYNRSYRPLCFSQQIWIHAGYNHWVDGVSTVEQLTFSNNVDGDWWSTKIKVPENAYILNWVLGDGPIKKANVYDNNNRKDYSAIVGPPEQDIKPFFEGVEKKIFERLQAARIEKTEAAATLAAKRNLVRKQMKEKTKEVFLRSQAHILYTEPTEPRAGEPVTVYYNPSNTVLNGRPEVYIRGSFNRWTHKKGLFAPIKMTPAENGTHLKATVTVPLDSYVMDFVFSDTPNESGGLYDNRGNLDYHIPVKGGTVTEPPMNIVHISLEMAPIAKVGGLGDVVTSLSRAVQELGHNVEVILPKYDCLKYNLIRNLEQREGFNFNGIDVGVWHGEVEGVSVHFLEPQSGQFWVGCIYGRKDDDARFGFFCHIALEFLLQSGRRPDILHSHDWSSAPVNWLFSEQYKNYGLVNARTVFTIHNLEFGAALIGRAMANCHKATTVSPTYALEISGNGAISPHLGKFHGIINGIDPDIWDPLGDPFIPVPYSFEDVVEGKIAAKKELRQRLGLAQSDKPLIGVVTRLTAQKGIHLIKHAIWRTLDRGGQIVLLGSAPDPRVQADFESLATQLSHSHSDQARLWLSYDEPLSHLIYAACDIILVPSMFEPCGLTQLIAMRYGAIPVVRKTGGLNDTVLDVDNDRERAKALSLQPNGFSFEGTDPLGLDYALNRAISAWYDGREWWNNLAKSVMEQDWTWNRPALDYLELYYGARK